MLESLFPLPDSPILAAQTESALAVISTAPMVIQLQSMPHTTAPDGVGPLEDGDSVCEDGTASIEEDTSSDGRHSLTRTSGWTSEGEVSSVKDEPGALAVEDRLTDPQESQFSKDRADDLYVPDPGRANQSATLESIPIDEQDSNSLEQINEAVEHKPKAEVPIAVAYSVNRSNMYMHPGSTPPSSQPLMPVRRLSDPTSLVSLEEAKSAPQPQGLSIGHSRSPSPFPEMPAALSTKMADVVRSPSRRQMEFLASPNEMAERGVQPPASQTPRASPVTPPDTASSSSSIAPGSEAGAEDSKRPTSDLTPPQREPIRRASSLRKPSSMEQTPIQHEGNPMTPPASPSPSSGSRSRFGGLKRRVSGLFTPPASPTLEQAEGREETTPIKKELPRSRLSFRRKSRTKGGEEAVQDSGTGEAIR